MQYLVITILSINWYICRLVKDLTRFLVRTRLMILV